MITSQLLATARTLRTSKHFDEDVFDRIIGTYSIVLIGVALFILTTSYFFGRPLALISCWCPAEFTGEMTNYANTICWASGSYLIPVHNDTLPGRHDPRPKPIGYYQWVPFILMLMAFVLFLPGFLWRRLRAVSRLEPKLTLSRLQKRGDPNDEGKRVFKIAEQFTQALQSERDYNYEYLSSFDAFLRPRTSLRRNGNYLYVCYLLYKLMYILNTLLLVVFLNYLMNFKKYFSMGGHPLRRLLSVGPLIATDRRKMIAYSNDGLNLFPFYTLCEFRIRALGDKFSDFLLQCTLPINIFNEKIFAFLWLWMIACLFLAVFSCLRFIYNNTVTKNRMFILSVCQHHMVKRSPPSMGPQMLILFVDGFLGADGVMILKSFWKHMHPVTFDIFVDILWNRFMDSQQWRYQSPDDLHPNGKLASSFDSDEKQECSPR